MFLFIITCISQCSKSTDVATTITLAKNKLNEYYQIQKQLRSTTFSAQQLQEMNIKSRSLINEAKIMLEQIDVVKLNIEEGIKTYLDVLEIEGNYDQCVEILQTLVRKNPENGNYWVRLGFCNMKKGREYLQDAFRCYEKAVKLKLNDSEKIRMWRSWGDIYWDLRQIEPAKQSYDKALETGEDIWAKVGLASIDVVEGKMEEAEKKLTALGKELQEYDIPVRLRMREALQLFEENKKNISDTPSEMLAYSHILYRAGRVEDAIAVAHQALSMDDQNWEGWNYLGSVYLQLGYWKDAEKTFTTSLKVKEDQPNIKKVLEELAKQGKGQGQKQESNQPLIFRKD